MATDIWAEPSVDLFGEIIDVRFEMFSYTDDDGVEVEQEKIVVEIVDLARSMDWNHTPRFTRASADKPNSKWAAFKSFMSQIGHVVKGEDDLVGHCFKFNLITWNPGDFESRNFPKAVKHFETKDECLAAAGAAGGESVGEGDGLTAVQERLLEIAHGKTIKQILSAALSDDLLKNDGAFVSALATGGTDEGPLSDLVASGELVLDGEEYQVVTTD